jgi:excinuclease UvrABC ATPase subunit
MKEEQKIKLLKEQVYPSREVIICHRCNGKGVETFDEGYHSSDYIDRLCRSCKGNRTLIKTTYELKHIEYEPAEPRKIDNLSVYEP